MTTLPMSFKQQKEVWIKEQLKVQEEVLLFPERQYRTIRNDDGDDHRDGPRLEFIPIKNDDDETNIDEDTPQPAGEKLPSGARCLAEETDPTAEDGWIAVSKKKKMWKAPMSTKLKANKSEHKNSLLPASSFFAPKTLEKYLTKPGKPCSTQQQSNMPSDSVKLSRNVQRHARNLARKRAEKEAAAKKGQQEHLKEKNNNDDDNSNSNNSNYYGGVDVSFPENDEDDGVAVYVVLDASNNMKVVYQDHEYFNVNEIPYIPSFLAFREIKPLERLIKKQLSEHAQFTPCCVLVDGNGMFHTRGAGIACFVGVRTNLPTIGIGKTLYCEGGLTKQIVRDEMQQSIQYIQESLGQQQDPPTNRSSAGSSSIEDAIIIDRQSIRGFSSQQQGQQQQPNITANDSTHKQVKLQKDKIETDDLFHKLRAYYGCQGIGIPLEVSDDRGILAYALVGHGGKMTTGETKATKTPIYVSVGHKISLLEAVRITASLCLSKIPEPVRQADLIGRDLMRRQNAKQNKTKYKQKASKKNNKIMPI